MTITSIFMLLVQQVQFIGMLSQLDIEWPTEWFTFTSVFNITNLSFENLVGSKKVPVITFRIIFILVSICVPLLVNVLLLVIFQPIFIVLWYLCLCIGVVFLCIGLAGKYLPDTGAGMATDSVDPMTFITIGAALFGFSILTLIVFQLHKRYSHDGKEAKHQFTEEVKYLRRFHRRRALKHCFVFLLCLVIALLCTRLVVVTIPRTGSAAFFDHAAWLVVGIVFAVFAFLALVYLVANLFRAGRRAVLKMINFFSKHVLLVLLTLISASFIPTVSYAVSIFMCTTYTCPAGTKFNPYAKRAPESYDTSEWLYCDPCNITAPTMCGQNVSATFEWCPAFKDRRSWKHPETSCSQEATYYFYIAAVIVLVIYLIGIPLLFARVIRYLTSNVVEHARIGKVLPDESEDSVWIRQMNAIQPVAASLYDPFRFPRRYFVLIQLAHRLIITMTISVAAAFSRSAVVFVFIFHAMICVILLITRPYVMTGEQVLSIALAICNVFNAIYAIIVWQVKEVPSYTTYIFLVLNGIIPALFLLVGAFLARRQRSKQANEHELKIAQLQLEAVDAAKNGELEAESPTQPNTREPYAVVPMTNITHQQQIIEETSMEESGSPTALTKRVPASNQNPAQSSSSSSDDDFNPEDIDPETLRRIKRIQKVRAHHNGIQTAVFDEKSTTQMNKAFMLMGIFFIIALGIAFLGLLREEKQSYLVGGESLYRSKTIMLADYPSWGNFTAHCCCIPQTTPNEDYLLAERWICDNGKTLERGRVRHDGSSGLPIRDMCSTSFNDFCFAQENPDSKIVEVKCPASSAAILLTSTDTQKFLW